jgi:hypothetical protein
LRSTRIFPDLDKYKGRLEFAEEGRGKSGKDIRAMLEKILESRCVIITMERSVIWMVLIFQRRRVSSEEARLDVPDQLARGRLDQGQTRVCLF